MWQIKVVNKDLLPKCMQDPLKHKTTHIAVTQRHLIISVCPTILMECPIQLFSLKKFHCIRFSIIWGWHKELISIVVTAARISSEALQITYSQVDCQYLKTKETCTKLEHFILSKYARRKGWEGCTAINERRASNTNDRFDLGLNGQQTQAFINEK